MCMFNYSWKHINKTCINLLMFFIHYSFDVRDRTSNQPKHWSAPEVFGPRANFSIDNTPESLIIKVILDPQRN